MVQFVHAPKALRTSAIGGLVGVIFVGVLCFMFCDLTAIQLRILAGYLPFFGVVGIFAELTIFGFLQKFAFLTSWIGKGLFYIFLGTLCIGSTLLGWIVGIYMICLGVVVIISRLHSPELFTEVGEGQQEGEDAEDVEKGGNDKKGDKAKGGGAAGENKQQQGGVSGFISNLQEKVEESATKATEAAMHQAAKQAVSNAGKKMFSYK
eukprot:TRINITY_DN50617_c0_g1_i2.p2 TRINITY_DN50617_c0_g1~~TRINITY_DN50617_c0_g1_i2.p2  ORF type:complete len:215 (-),score=31.33 TRINITY_DN50617_c0_g1_i2:1165-1785(-)